MTEEYFPRGGKKPNVTYFKQSNNFLGAAEKGQGKKKKQKKKPENDDGYLSDEAVKEVDQSYKMCAAGIGYKTLKPGLNVLGRVWRVLETKLRIMMPGKTEGNVMACHISEPYNKMLEAYVNDETEKVCELPKMFSPGQYVAVHVLEADGGSEGVMLSMMPQHVNSGRTHSELLKGDILQAAVSSVEDHGYVMDIGVANTRAFLPKADANPEIELDTGMLTWTCVKSVATSADSSIVTLSGAPDALQKAIRRKKGALPPGTAVEFIVDKPLDNGIEGRVLDSTAYVQRFHADRAKDKKPALGQKIRAHVLYVMPTRKAPFLTTRNIFESVPPNLEEEIKLKEGDIVDDAQVLKIAGRSIHFKLGKKCVGTMSLKRVAVHEDLSDEQIVAQSYPIGSTHRVRVITYNLADYIYHVTDETKLLTEKYFSYSQLNPGDVVTGTIRTVADNQVKVTVGRLTGVVPHLHVSDAGVYVDPKKATTSKLTKKKYKVGQEVRALVLSVNCLAQTLYLSLKPSLLAQDAAILTSYEQAEIGKAYTGIIKVVKDFVLVSFLCEVVAYVPRNQVSRTPVPQLSAAFHPGQVVTCTVLQVDPENKKMLGSLTIAPFWPAKRSSEHREKRKMETEDSEVPHKKRKTSESDDADTNTKKKDKRSKTKVVSEDSDAGDTDTKKKPSLLASDAATLASYEQAEIGKAYTGTIKVVKDFMLVSFLGDVVAYVPRNQVSRTPVPQLSAAFHPGQVVTCTVLQVDPANKKMLGSLTIAPFWPAKRSSEHREKREIEIQDSEVPHKNQKTSEANDADTKTKKKDKKSKTKDVSEDSDAGDTDTKKKPSLLASDAATLASYEQAEIGKAYTGTIKVVKDFVLVSFLGDVVAYVPRNQVSRTPVPQLSAAFHPGQVVTCTVLQVDPANKKMLGSLTIAPFWPAKRSSEHREKREIEIQDSEVPHKNQKTSEANDADTKTKKKDKKSKTKDVSEDSDAGDTDTKKKPSLLASDAATLASYEQAEIGKAYTGTIKVVKDFVLVSFVGDVVAYVPRNQVSRTPVPQLSAAFHPGQVVTCTVLQVDPANKKMLGSLTIAPFWPAKRSSEHHEKREIEIQNSEVPHKNQKTSEADDADTKTKKKGKKSKTNHVSEDSDAGDTDAKKKPSLLASDGATLASYEQAEIGKAYTGTIKVVKDFVLVSFVGDVVAYVPRNQVSRTPVPQLSIAFHPGQVVTCTVLQVDPANKKMLGSLTIAPFWPAKRSNEHREKREIETQGDESDAIETDIHEDSDQVLTPEDLALIDLSDCETAKQWKKRVVSLMKSIKCRLHRIERLDKKLEKIEQEGLSTENKKFHTAMHQEKLVIEERMKKLMEAMKTAQEKLKEFDEEEYRDPNYKEKQKQKKEEKKKLLKQAANKDDDTEDETVPEVKKNKKKDKLKEKLKNENVTDDDDDEEDAKDKKKRKREKNKKEVKDVVDKSKDIKVVESLEPALDVPSAKDFWSENADNLANNAKEESSSSSEDEETEQPKKKRKKLTAAEKVAKARAEEDRLRELERRAIDGDAQPRSSEQFERALLANPNCSQLWIAYMAFHLQATEIDKARAVGRKALNTISFREEGEKLNVWLAMLNVEHRFGTKESQQKTLEEALQMNDTYKVHSKLLDIYVDTSKHQELSSLVDLMLRKYKREPANYIQCGTACFKLGLLDKARHVMQKAVSVLEKKEHVTVLVQFALLERAHGSRERAEALFEQVLAVYPTRLDACAAYADMLAKDRDMAAVRQVMERMTSHKLPARKMKTLFNKWAELEERAGDAARAEEIRERAVKFMETAKF